MLVALGSQGDVRPFVALADRLRRAGHSPLLVAPRVFEPVAMAYAVPFEPLDVDLTAAAAALSPHRRPGPGQVLRIAGGLRRQVRPALPRLRETLAAQGFDALVYHPLFRAGQRLAGYLDVPAVVATPVPAVVPTSAFTAPVWSGEVPEWARRGSYHLLRATGTVPRLRARRPVLHAFSPHVVARPYDWPRSAHVTGYWFLPPPAGWTPPRGLQEFLAAGDPPVYVGFGSMPLSGVAALARTVDEAVERLGRRAVLAVGHHPPGRLPPLRRTRVVRHVPHEWLLPRMAAVVHHGGAGTVGAAVAAGRPQVLCPVGLDQPFWAGRMRDLGVAADPVPMHRLTAPALEAALRQVLHDDATVRRAGELGGRVRAEDGTGWAVGYLSRLAGRQPAQPVGGRR